MSNSGPITNPHPHPKKQLHKERMLFFFFRCPNIFQNLGHLLSWGPKRQCFELNKNPMGFNRGHQIKPTQTMHYSKGNPLKFTIPLHCSWSPSKWVANLMTPCTSLLKLVADRGHISWEVKTRNISCSAWQKSRQNEQFSVGLLVCEVILRDLHFFPIINL